MMDLYKPSGSAKQVNLEEYKTLKQMLDYFKERNDRRNASVMSLREGHKYIRPLETIKVQELKDYMLNILEKGMDL